MKKSLLRISGATFAFTCAVSSAQAEILPFSPISTPPTSASSTSYTFSDSTIPSTAYSYPLAHSLHPQVFASETTSDSEKTPPTQELPSPHNESETPITDASPSPYTPESEDSSHPSREINKDNDTTPPHNSPTPIPHSSTPSDNKPTSSLHDTTDSLTDSSPAEDTTHSDDTAEHQPHDIAAMGRELRIHVRNSLTSGPAESLVALGHDSDLVFFGDWDGDGKDTFAIRRGTTMYLTNSPDASTLDAVFSLGHPSDQVFVGDWDGNGTDTFALRQGNTMRVSTTLDFSSDVSSFTYGRASDDVYVGDWDSNGTDTFAVRRAPNIIHVKNSVTGGQSDVSFTYGRVGDDLISGDWDGNGSDTFLVRRGNVMYPKSTLTGGYSDYSFTYGTPNDRTFAGDWDGDRKDSFVVVRDSHNSPKFRHPSGRINAIIGTWSSHVSYIVMAVHVYDPNYPSYTPRYDIILDGKTAENQRQASSTTPHNTSLQAAPGHHTVCIRVYGHDAGNSLTTSCAQVVVPAYPPQPDGQIPVFVYGSLRPGAEAHGDLHGRYNRVIPTSVVNEDLWITHTSTYGSDVWPWALPGNNTGNLRGEALTYGANYSSELQRLDRYESARPDLPESRRNYNRVQKQTTDGWWVWLYEASSWRQDYVRRRGYKVPSGDIFRR